MPARARDWLAQALRDLDQAKTPAASVGTSGRRSARVGVLRRSPGSRESSESVASPPRPGALGAGDCPPPAQSASSASPPDLIDRAHVLGGCYIPMQYPGGHPEGAPFEHSGPL